MNPDSCKHRVREAICPACGHHVAVPFLRGGSQPLATLGWPETPELAQAMTRLPVDFVRCVECGHVYNPDFDYSKVPYGDRPNLMFNSGTRWSTFIRNTVRRMVRTLPERPIVVEIGHGDGSFLAALAKELPMGGFVGFDPHGATHGPAGVELRAEMFDPAVHLAELQPDIVISRHVLEHLTSPLAFLQRLTFAAAQLERDQLAYLEVPCIDRALQAYRTVDFYYEHNSQFTSHSFRMMLSRCGAEPAEIGHGYDDEVIYSYVRLAGKRSQVEIAGAAGDFFDSTCAAIPRIGRELEKLRNSGARIAIWGGTGKSAAFINRYGLDAVRFPAVVDSDPAKVGTYVPGAGQEIRRPQWLKEHPADVILIPPQWRARDVVLEMEREGIPFAQVLIEHHGHLIDYFRSPHPYLQRPEASNEDHSPLPTTSVKSGSDFVMSS